MGGGFALLLAPRGQFAVASINYGGASKERYSADFLRGSCPVVGSFGTRDRALKGAAARLEDALTELGVEHDVKEYPGAGHSFINDRSGPGGSVLKAVGDRLMPAGYHEPSAVDARRRIAGFLHKHLQQND